MINFLSSNWAKRYAGKDQGVTGLGRSLEKPTFGKWPREGSPKT